MFQVKEQDKTSEKVLTEIEINDLPVKEIKIMVIIMFYQFHYLSETLGENIYIFIVG